MPRLRVILFGEPASTFSLLHYAALTGDPRVDLLLWVASPPASGTTTAVRVPFLSARHRLQRMRMRLALEMNTLRNFGRPARLIQPRPEILHTSRLRTDTTLGARLAGLHPDLVIAAGFRQILPPPILAIPRLGAFNCHPSPLPRYAGSNPWFWLLRNGERSSAVTIHRMVEKVDAGDICAQKSFAIGASENHQSLYNRSSVASAVLLRECIRHWLQATLNERPQDLSQRTFFRTPGERDLQIDWSQQSRQIADLLRAASPAPGAWLPLGQRRIVVHAVVPLTDFPAPPGVIARMDRSGLVVGCAGGSVRLTCVSVGPHVAFGSQIGRLLGTAAGDRLGGPPS